MLEDGERALQLCMSLRPEALSPRVLMMTNLIMQNRYQTIAMSMRQVMHFVSNEIAL